MNITSIHINYECDKTLNFDMPNGTVDNLFVLFKSPSKVWIDNQVVSASPNCFMFFKNTTRQKYTADNCNFLHDFIRFTWDNDVEKQMYAHIPMDKLVTTPESTPLQKSLVSLSEEFYSTSPYCKDNLSLLFRLFMSRVAEIIYATKSPHISEQHTDALLELRTAIMQNPSNDWTVNCMAERLNLSKTYFQTLYKSHFGITCMNDVISARIEKAKWFLTYTTYHVEKIAEYCGYKNVEHFIRQFKAHTNTTPYKYRIKNDTE